MKKKSRILASVLTAAAIVAAVVGVQTANADSEKVYIPSSYGETAIYKVSKPRTLGSILGTDAGGIDHICLLKYGEYFTISDPAQIEDLVAKLSSVQFQQLSGDPGISGGDNTLLIFPKDGKGYLSIGDGGSGKIFNNDGSTFPVEDGNYQIEESSFDQWSNTLKTYYNTAVSQNALKPYDFENDHFVTDFYAY